MIWSASKKAQANAEDHLEQMNWQDLVHLTWSKIGTWKKSSRFVPSCAFHVYLTVIRAVALYSIRAMKT